MPSLRVGSATIGPRAARRIAVAASIVALAGGLCLGVATAADPLDAGAAIGGPRNGPTGAARPVTRASRLLAWPWDGASPRRPLHTLIGTRLRESARSRGEPEQRVLVGRLVQLGPNSGVVRLAQGRLRQVRLTPQTARPARRLEPGDTVLILGNSAADGTFHARAVLSRSASRARTGAPQAERTGSTMR